MKKIFGFIVLIVLSVVILTSGGDAQNAIKSSGLQAASAAVVAKATQFYGIEIITNGTNAVAIVVYDNATTNTGTILFQGTVAGASNFGGVLYTNPVEAMKGIYVDMTGTGGSYIVFYRVR